MSVTSPDDGSVSPIEPATLIIKDVQYQFLPNLAAIYGDTCAVMMQQLHFTMVKGTFRTEPLKIQRHQGLDYIRLWPFMWYDTIYGITKHLSKSTFYRYIGVMKECKAMLVETNLGGKNLRSSRRNEDAAPSWYALNHPVIQLHSQAYEAAFQAAKNERDAQTERIRQDDGWGAWWPRC
ncbi:MAG: hypothetical protein EOP10_23195, partial [Proteobacteria bacterium]